MPEVGSLNQRATIDTTAITTDVVSETLIFSSDVIKTETFNPEDHVILVVPESSEHLVTAEGVVDGEATSYVIPAENVDVDGTPLEPNRLRETIKSNFLVIAKLLPSKSPPPLVPIEGKADGLTTVNEIGTEGVILQRLTDLPKAILPKPVPNRTAKQSKTPKQNSGKQNSSIKQEGPEIFGKMFPASYNEVLWKQIKDIIYFKCGKDATDDTEVTAGINCPHCRKKSSTLNKLKEHLQNCHTYSSTKRKSSGSTSKNVMKKLLFPCQYCDEAFISQSHRESHECSLAAKPLAHLEDVSKSHPNTCTICCQDFGSRSELSIHQEIDHKGVRNPQKPVDPSPSGKSAPASLKPTATQMSKYVSCKVCGKKVSLSILCQHIKRAHSEPSAVVLTCVKCQAPNTELDSKMCSSCRQQPQNSDFDSLECCICPICDKEVAMSIMDAHVKTH